MTGIKFSKHALEQIAVRGIPVEVAQSVLINLQQIITESGKKIYQSIVNFEDDDYLVRVIVNAEIEPNLVITVYKTSKIKKYYEG